MERIRFVELEGKRILHIDFSNMDARQFEAAIGEAKKVIAAQPPASLLTLTDFTSVRFDDAAVKTLKDYTRHNRPFVRAAALVGITGLKKIVLNTVKLVSQREFSVFDDAEAAKSWLCTRDD